MIPRHLQIAIVVLVFAIFGMGFYLLHLKSKAEQVEQQTMHDASVAAPAPGQLSRARLYIAHDDTLRLAEHEVEIALPNEPSERIRALLDALFHEYRKRNSPHPLGSGADVQDVFVVARVTAVVDFNAALAEQHRSGIVVEQLTLASVVRTIAANVPAVRHVKFLVEGQERETLAGHADLGVVYDVSTIGELVRE